MTDYTDAFSSAAIPSAEASYGAHTLTENTTFFWPYNYSGSGSVISKTMEIDCSTAGVVMTMPSAAEVSDGEATLIRNTGSETLTIKKSDASALTTIAAGVAVMLLMTDNSTAAGTWSVTTYGTGSSAADAATLAGYGLEASGTTLTSAFPSETQAAGWTVDLYDRAKVFIYTGGADTVALPAVADVNDSFFFLIRNAGTGTLTVDPNGAETIDANTTIALNPGESTIIVCDGLEWHTIGSGRSLVYQFTQLVKDVSAAGSFTLTSTEAGNKLLTFTGNPASAVTIVVPDVVSIYYVYSDISTTQTITVQTAAGASAAVTKGQRAIMFCDAVDIMAAQTSTVSGAINTIDITNGAVTYAKIQDVSATDKLLGRSTAGAGDIEEISCTAFGRSILDDADEATFKATVNLEIGTDVQAYDADTAKLDAVQTWTAAQTFTSTLSLTGASSTLGYGSGSGGTVTQATSKDTGVTLHKACGQITMNAAALGAGDSVNFYLTNNLLVGSDLLVVSVWSTPAKYLVQVITTYTGTAHLRVTNLTAGSLSEAVVINFAVIKGATS